MKGKEKIRKFILVGLVLILQLSLLTGFIYMEVYRVKQSYALEVSQRYAEFSDKMQNHLVKYTNLVKGFSAFIQTFEEYDTEKIYQYLGYLTEEDRDFIRNIGITKGTVVLWNYPKEGNEKAIGVDLLEIPGQKEMVQKVLDSGKFSFDGPIELVQGGKGYVIRVPFEKDGVFWGMASIVLRADKLRDLIQTFSEDSQLEVVIVEQTNERVIYGEEEKIQKASFSYVNTYNGGNWRVYVLPKDTIEAGDLSYLILIFALGLILSIWNTYHFHRIYQHTENVKKDNLLLEKSVMHDALTGIYNRNYFDRKLLELLKQCQNGNVSLSVIFFDLDDFKKVNDRFGHLTGDMVLKVTADTVKSVLRGSDIFARWGGEEFAILLPQSSIEISGEVAERARKALEEVIHPAIGVVTASFGVAEFSQEETGEQLIARVDEALYEAKKAGKNCVKIK